VTRPDRVVLPRKDAANRYGPRRPGHSRQRAGQRGGERGLCQQSLRACL